LRLDASSLIPSDNPQLISSTRAANLFGLRDAIIIGIANKNSSIYNPSTLERIIRMSDAVAQIDGVAPRSVVSLATTPVASRRNGSPEMLPLISEGRDLEEAVLRRIRREVESAGLDNGILVSSDGSATAIFAEVERGADRYRILDRVRDLVTREAGGDDSIHLSGTALAQAILGESAALDLARLIPAVILILAAALIVAFRNPAPALISLSEIGASLILTIGLMGIFGQSVFVTTLVLPVILICVGVSDDVYALTHYFNEARHRQNRTEPEVVVAAFARILKPVSLTAISTSVGLLSLAVTGIQPLRVFGVFGAVAILFSSLFTFTLVPALLLVLKPRLNAGRRRQTGRRRAMFALINGVRFFRPARLLLLTLAAAVCAAVLGARVNVDDSWIRNLPEDSDIARGDAPLNDLLAGTTTVDLMLGSEDGFTDPKNFVVLGAIEDAAGAVTYVGGVHSAFTEVVRALAALKNVEYQAFRAAILRNEAGITREDIESALSLMASGERPRIHFFASIFDSARVTIFIRSATYERIGSVLGVASAAAHDASKGSIEVRPFGDGWISYLTVQLLVKGQVYSIGLALVTDLVLLSLFFGSVRAGLTAVLPVAFSVVVVFAVLAATRTPLGIANSMFAGIAIGIGLDFSIHLTTAYRQGLFRGLRASRSLVRAVVNTGPAIITSAAAVSAGFSVLALSEVTPNVQLGLMISLSLLVCAGATLLLVPSLALVGPKRE
jgi:predicted RND superfamily exporter protein